MSLQVFNSRAILPTDFILERPQIKRTLSNPAAPTQGFPCLFATVLD